MPDRSLNSMTPDAAATYWLLVHDAGLTASDEAEFETWLSASQANGEAWAHASGVWSEFDGESDALLASMHRSALELRPRSSRAMGVNAWAAIAASVLLFFIGATAWMRFGFPPFATHSTELAAASTSSFESGADGRDIVLADGSKVRMDLESRLLVQQTPARRDVRLIAGRAYFDVAHDPRRPFVVASAGHEVTDTGTAFAVSVEDGQLSVILARGSVMVASATGPNAQMVPGQEYRVLANGHATLKTVDVDRALAWRTGYVELRDVTVNDALAAMNAGASNPVAVGEQAVGALKVSGRFRAKDPMRFARTLTIMYPVEIRTKSDGHEALYMARHTGRR